MVWKVRADVTYTTSANKTTRQNEVQGILDTYNTLHWAAEGRFPAGLVSHSTTRFTVSIDCPDEDSARTIMTDLRAALTASARSQTYFSYHDAGDG